MHSREILDAAGITEEQITNEGLILRKVNQEELDIIGEDLQKFLYPGVCVAGGSVFASVHSRSAKYPKRTIKDFDIFFKHESEIFSAVGRLENILDFDFTRRTMNSLQVKEEKDTNEPWFELIHKRFGTPYEIISSFDLDVCQGAIFMVSENSEFDISSEIVHGEFYLLAKSNFGGEEAHFTSKERLSESGSLSRISKYMNKGFIFSEKTIKKAIRAWYDNTNYLHHVMSFKKFDYHFIELSEASNLKETSFHPMSESNFIVESNIISEYRESLDSIDNDDNRIDKFEEKLRNRIYEIITVGNMSRGESEKVFQVILKKMISIPSEDLISLFDFNRYTSNPSNILQDALIVRKLLSAYENTESFRNNEMTDDEISAHISDTIVFIEELPERIQESGKLLSFDGWSEASESFDPHSLYEFMTMLYDAEPLKEDLELSFTVSF